MTSFSALADEIAALEERVSDAVFDAVRAQLRDDDSARDVERQLARVRRSLQKAEAILRGLPD
ncbi:MAG: hypothetical protein ACYDEH_03520 [Acidimicrobiales bacterium]